MPVFSGIGLGAEFFGGLGKVAGHLGTKIRERAAGEKESDGEGFAFEIAQAHGLAEFVGEMMIGQKIARLEFVHDGHHADGRARGAVPAATGSVWRCDQSRPSVALTIMRKDMASPGLRPRSSLVFLTSNGMVMAFM